MGKFYVVKYISLGHRYCISGCVRYFGRNYQQNRSRRLAEKKRKSTKVLIIFRYHHNQGLLEDLLFVVMRESQFPETKTRCSECSLGYVCS